MPETTFLESLQPKQAKPKPTAETAKPAAEAAAVAKHAKQKAEQYNAAEHSFVRRISNGDVPQHGDFVFGGDYILGYGDKDIRRAFKMIPKEYITFASCRTTLLLFLEQRDPSAPSQSIQMEIAFKQVDAKLSTYQPRDEWELLALRQHNLYGNAFQAGIQAGHMFSPLDRTFTMLYEVNRLTEPERMKYGYSGTLLNDANKLSLMSNTLEEARTELSEIVLTSNTVDLSEFGANPNRQDIVARINACTTVTAFKEFLPWVGYTAPNLVPPRIAQPTGVPIYNL